MAEAALQAALAPAKRDGIAVVAIANNNHLGMMSWYAEWLASRGLISIGLSTSEALVHAWGGTKAMLGTNPIAIGIPAEPRPFVLDMATSLVSMGQIHDYAEKGLPIEPGWALDADGNPTTDAGLAKTGSLSPFGGPKGFALGLAIQLLVASLTSSALGRDVLGTLDETQVCNKGDVFILVDPAAASGHAISRVIGDYLAQIRSDTPAAGFDRVAIPNDRALAVREQRLRDGVPMSERLWGTLLSLSQAKIH